MISKYPNFYPSSIKFLPINTHPVKFINSLFLQENLLGTGIYLLIKCYNMQGSGQGYEVNHIYNTKVLESLRMKKRMVPCSSKK